MTILNTHPAASLVATAALGAGALAAGQYAVPYAAPIAASLMVTGVEACNSATGAILMGVTAATDATDAALTFITAHPVLSAGVAVLGFGAYSAWSYNTGADNFFTRAIRTGVQGVREAKASIWPTKPTTHASARNSGLSKKEAAALKILQDYTETMRNLSVSRAAAGTVHNLSDPIHSAGGQAAMA